MSMSISRLGRLAGRPAYECLATLGTSGLALERAQWYFPGQLTARGQGYGHAQPLWK